MVLAFRSIYFGVTKYIRYIRHQQFCVVHAPKYMHVFVCISQSRAYQSAQTTYTWQTSQQRNTPTDINRRLLANTLSNMGYFSIKI